jgi:threonine 3-dehydrogenase
LTKTMKALVKQKAGPGLTLQKMEVPEPGPRDVLVQVQAASICGTDFHIYNWDSWAASRVKPPLVVGHEMAGIVVKTGAQVVGWAEGDYVSLECHQSCGQCLQCRTGRAHICKMTMIQGVDTDGCFAEYVKIPCNNLWRNDPRLPPEIACLQDPVGNAVMAVTSGCIAGKTLLITGCGALGLLAVGVARALGASRVIALDINDYRLQIAQRLGATKTINPLRQGPLAEVLRATKGEGIDVLLEMSGAEECLHIGLKALKNGGRAALLGIPAESISLDLAEEVIFKGVTLAGITGREIFATWYRTDDLLINNLDISQVITHRMPMEAYEEAFAILESGRCGKIILFPGEYRGKEREGGKA